MCYCREADCGVENSPMTTSKFRLCTNFLVTNCTVSVICVDAVVGQFVWRDAIIVQARMWKSKCDVFNSFLKLFVLLWTNRQHTHHCPLQPRLPNLLHAQKSPKGSGRPGEDGLPLWPPRVVRSRLFGHHDSNPVWGLFLFSLEESGVPVVNHQNLETPCLYWCFSICSKFKIACDKFSLVMFKHHTSNHHCFWGSEEALCCTYSFCYAAVCMCCLIMFGLIQLAVLYSLFLEVINIFPTNIPFYFLECTHLGTSNLQVKNSACHSSNYSKIIKQLQS